MIASLHGILELIDHPFIIINVGGVGYKVLVSQSAFSKLGQKGSEVHIFTFTNVKEDALELYGFTTYEDLKLFEMLISVAGIGPKTAIGAFSIATSAQILQAIMDGDVAFFTQVPRLGKKNAQKIIIELKNKVGSRAELDLSEGGQEYDELVSALKVLGYSEKEVYAAAKQIDQEKPLEEQVKMALKYLGK